MSGEILTPGAITAMLAPIMERIAGYAAGRIVSEGGTRPGEGPYCALGWKSIRRLQQNHGDYATETDAAGAETYLQHLRNECEGVIGITFMGEAAFDAALAAQGWLECDDRQYDLWKPPLGYGGLGDITDASLVFGAEWYGKAYFELTLNVSFGATYPVDYFTASQWKLETYSGDGDTPRTEEHTYPDETP